MINYSFNYEVNNTKYSAEWCDITNRLLILVDLKGWHEVALITNFLAYSRQDIEKQIEALDKRIKKDGLNVVCEEELFKH